MTKLLRGCRITRRQAAAMAIEAIVIAAVVIAVVIGTAHAH